MGGPATSEGRRFEVLEVLGAGGFGAVYRARVLGEGQFTKEVALKLLHEGLEDEEELTVRLRDEARLLGLLRHRAIIRTDGLIRVDGRWAVLMEYVEGADLGQVLGSGPLPPKVALEVVAEVASALHAAWNTKGPAGQPLRLMHRDIKPSNIQLTSYGEVKLLDFGIARAEFAAREAQTRSIHFGSPAYMSPERLDFQDSDSADVYALGVVLYELLQGQNFGKTSAVLDRHEQVVRPALDQLKEREDLPAELLSLLESCLAWDPAARPGRRTLEREATRLAATLPGDPLRFWAELAVAKAATRRQERPPDSTILTEGPAPTPLTQPPPPGLTPARVALLALLTVLLGVGIFEGTRGWRATPAPAEPEAPSLPEELPVSLVEMPEPSPAQDEPEEPAPPAERAASKTPAPRGSAAQPSAIDKRELSDHAITLGEGTEGVHSIELDCPGGFRQRARAVDGVARFQGVPHETCDAYAKGTPPAKGQIQGGTLTSTCSIAGTTLVCI